MSASTARRPLLPPVYFFLALVAMVVLRFTVPGRLWPAPPWNFAVGLAALAAGLALGLGGRLRFVKHGTTVKPFETSSALVTDGVFRWSRNPMYLGMLLVLTGTGLLMRAPITLLVVPLFAWWIAARFIAREERDLDAQFGDAYRAYRARVRRWL